MIQQILIHKGNAAQQNIHSLNGCTCHKIGNKIEICFHVLVMCIGECVDGVFRNKAGCSTQRFHNISCISRSTDFIAVHTQWGTIFHDSL